MLGVVLAGGAGQRIGGDKALVELGGRSLIEWVLAAFERAGLECVVVAKDHNGLERSGVKVVVEPSNPRHPLLGLVTALEWAAGSPIVTSPCDVPFVTPELLRLLATTEGSAVVPRVSGRLQPLIARYEPSTLGVLRAALEAETSMAATLNRLGPATLEGTELAGIGDLERVFFNVNSSDDLAVAERYASGIRTASAPLGGRIAAR